MFSWMERWTGTGETDKTQVTRRGKFPPSKMPVAAIVLTLLGDLDYLPPATFFLVVAIDLGQFPLNIVIVPVSTIGILGCVAMMGAVPKKHVVWGILVLSFASLAIAFDGYILIAFPSASGVPNS